MTTPLLEMNDVHAGYKDLLVLQGVTLHVNKGEIVALLGQNGAGKSTLFKTIIGLVHPRSGHITKPTKISYVPQGKRIFPSLTVEENVLLISKEKEIPSFLLSLFPILKSKKGRPAKNLSGGEQQMVALARGLMGKPDLLLLDEPSLGLSPKFTKEVFAVVAKIREELGISVIVIEHNIASLTTIADRGYVLEHGTVIQELSQSDFHDKASIWNAIMGK